MTGVPVSPQQLRSRSSLYRAYDALRSEGGVRETDLGSWVTDYSGCRSVLADDRFGSDLSALVGRGSARGNLLFRDPPEHARLRRSVAEALPRSDDSFRGFVAESCDELFATLEGRTSIDVVADVAQPMAARVVARILGIRDVSLPGLCRSLSSIRALMDPVADQRSRTEARAASLQLMRTFSRDRVDPIRRAPAGALDILARDESSARDPVLLSATAVMLAHASYENTANFIAGAILHLLDDAELRERARDLGGDSELLEELLRICTPAHTLVRLTRVDTQIGGTEVPAGRLVFAMLGAANRDPQQFSEPAHVEHGRRGQHLAFGHGRHACPGASLARDEARLVIERFVRRFPRSRRTGPENWGTSITMRGLRSLRIDTARARTGGHGGPRITSGLGRLEAGYDCRRTAPHVPRCRTVTSVTTPKSTDDRRFRHEAVLYAGPADFVEQLAPFVADGVARGEPVLAMLAPGRTELLRAALGRDAARVAFADMTEVGRNPARIIPEWMEFARDPVVAGRGARGIGEPIWAGRSRDELTECHLHESLLNVAFADADLWLVCPYDTDALEPSVVEGALCTHPLVATNGMHTASPAYRAGAMTPAPLGDPPARARGFEYDITSLRDARAFVGRHATELGLDRDRAETLVFVANELVTNSLRYGGGRGRLLVWRDEHQVVCDVVDHGWIAEALAGRVRPTPEQEGGRGLWLANQLCELVQIRTSPTATTVRIHLAG